MQIQTRSADEPMTTFYKCCSLQCGHRWRDWASYNLRLKGCVPLVFISGGKKVFKLEWYSTWTIGIDHIRWRLRLLLHYYDFQNLCLERLPWIYSCGWIFLQSDEFVFSGQWCTVWWSCCQLYCEKRRKLALLAKLSCLANFLRKYKRAVNVFDLLWYEHKYNYIYGYETLWTLWYYLYG